jgi:hypothetical protein
LITIQHFLPQAEKEMRGLVRFPFFLLVVACCLYQTTAFPKRRLVNTSTTEFSRERVKLSHQKSNEAVGPATPQRAEIISRTAILRFDALVGIVYATGFFLFPNKTLSLFFEYEFDPSIRAFLHLAVRMIAVNHVGYVAGLLAAPPEHAIKVATGFLTFGGAIVVYCGQAKLKTTAAFWTCTILTSAMIVAHVLAL